MRCRTMKTISEEMGEAAAAVLYSKFSCRIIKVDMFQEHVYYTNPK